jgi:dimeric dUTPase (all-alpha-NTP-PPase superfamily)
MDKLVEMFEMQKDLQRKINGSIGLPMDKQSLFEKQVLGLICELGEVLKADERWKEVRILHVNRLEKLDEIVDCFCFLVNMCLYSGFSSFELYDAFVEKYKINVERDM